MEHVSSIKWNDEGFKNIAIDPDRKVLVQSLVESHAQGHPFDDFVQGKGRGLVINLFGELAAATCKSVAVPEVKTSPSYRTARRWQDSNSRGNQRTYVPILTLRMEKI